MSETATHTRIYTSPPDPSEEPTQRLDIVDPNAPESVGDIIEKHQGLRDMKAQARRVFEFNDGVAGSPDLAMFKKEKNALRQQKVRLLEGFPGRLERFRDSKANQVVDNFPEETQREEMIEGMIEIHEKPPG